MNDVVSQFREVWETAEKETPNPHFLRNIIILDADEFINKIRTANQQDILELVSSIYAGDAYILKNAVSKEITENIKERVVNWSATTPEGYQPMIEGCTNYHSITDTGRGPEGGYTSLEHSYVFFRHDKDPLYLFDEFDKYFQAVKILSGNEPNAFVGNTPIDGVIDRITFIQYPVGFGKITTHFDPAKTQKLLIGGIFSQIGEHYNFGENGFYLVDKNRKNIYLENLITQGDFICAYPTMYHGVPTVTGDTGSEMGWDSTGGRWYMQCYSPESPFCKISK